MCHFDSWHVDHCGKWFWAMPGSSSQDMAGDHKRMQLDETTIRLKLLKPCSAPLEWKNPIVNRSIMTSPSPPGHSLTSIELELAELLPARREDHHGPPVSSVAASARNMSCIVALNNKSCMDHMDMIGYVWFMQTCPTICIMVSNNSPTHVLDSFSYILLELFSSLQPTKTQTFKKKNKQP